MIAVTLRGLLSRKLRTVLTMIAIVLGVSMISGTYMLTDSLTQSVNQILSTANAATDALITAKSPVNASYSAPTYLPARLLPIVRHVPGVAAAEGQVGTNVQLVERNGIAINATSGGPTLFFSPTPRFLPAIVIRGHLPHGREIALDTDTVSRNHLHLGQSIGVVALQNARYLTLAGVIKLGGFQSVGGTILAETDLTEARTITGEAGEYDVIKVAATPNISQHDLVARIRARIPLSLRRSIQVETGQKNIQDQLAADEGTLNVLTVALLVFGAIAVFVGAFIIFNTFSITVAQRLREFGLLRSLGASRGQVLRSVILEALLIGVAASFIGLFAGLGIARALEGLFTLTGSDLPSGTLVIAGRTIAVALLTGTVVTLVAALMPAMRAMSVPPIAALREGAVLPRSRFARYTPILTAIVTAAGALLVFLGIFASIPSSNDRLLVLGAGAILLFLGVAMLSPRLIRPLAGVLGWPIERFSHVTGLLARDNTVRNPSRTAVTAAALMIGLALVSFVTIFAAELRQTADASINREITGSMTIYNDNSNPIPEGVAAAAARVRGVQAASAVKETGGGIRGYGTAQVNGIQPATLLKVYRFQWKEGAPASITTMGPYDAVVEEALARKLKLHLGSHLRVRTGTGAIRTFTVRGIYQTVQFLTDLTIRYDTVRRDWGMTQDAAVVVSAEPGQNLSVLKARLTRALQRPYPSATVHSEAEFKAQQTQGVNRELELIYVLLAMSLIVSLFGIINTLALSVYERTREIGMLRAMGTTRSQIRWIVRWESVITSLIGAVLGVILGFALAMLVTAGLSSQRIQYAFPIGQLLIWVVVAVLLGIVAAAWPARRAARLDVLQALTYE